MPSMLVTVRGRLIRGKPRFYLSFKQDNMQKLGLEKDKTYFAVISKIKPEIDLSRGIEDV